MDLNLKVSAWAESIGYRNAVAILYQKGVSARVAELLCSGRYPKSPQPMLVSVIENAITQGKEINKEGEKPS